MQSKPTSLRAGTRLWCDIRISPTLPETGTPVFIRSPNKLERFSAFAVLGMRG